MSAKTPSWDNHDERFGPIDQADYRANITADTYENTNTVSSTTDVSTKSASPTAIYRPNFRIRLDVRQFEPDEIAVHHEGDFISVKGKHEERTDEYGFISREFNRRYEIPADVDTSGIKCSWHPDHVLVIKAPIVSSGTSDENFDPVALPSDNPEDHV